MAGQGFSDRADYTPRRRSWRLREPVDSHRSRHRL